MEKAEKLFVLNPLLHSSLKKYLWFKDDVRQKEGMLLIFWQLLVQEIYIEGFATDNEEYIGERAFNKPIVDIRKLNFDEAVVFVEWDYEEEIYDICKAVTVVNSIINREKMVIFGAGKYGAEVYEQLVRRGMGRGIYCFLDSDETKYGREKKKEGLTIHNVSVLLEMPEEVCVIEAAQVYEEMDQFLCERGIKQKRFYYINEYKERQKLMSQYYNYIKFGIDYIGELCSKYYDKKFFYYGKRDVLTEKTKRCFQLLGFNFCGYLCDECEEQNRKEDDYIVEDILYNENFFILLDKFHNQKERRKLRDLGLELGIDYNLIDSCGYTTNMDNLMLDLNLGFVYKQGEKYTGFAVYGEENEEDYKIVTLGASTTDGNINWDKCWPQILYERLSLKKKVTVYNGGIAGYNSGQELIKMIRDVLPLEPNLVIVYDGYIDGGNNRVDSPLAFPYLRKIFDFAGSHMDIMENGMGIDEGVKSKKQAFENWISNIEMMYAIAKLRGISFFSFVQPSRFMMKRENVIDSWRFSNIFFWKERYKQPFVEFRKKLQSQEIKETHDYIIDLTGLFDDKPEVYMDAVHVYEAGNEIIAEAILNVVSKTVLENEL